MELYSDYPTTINILEYFISFKTVYQSIVCFDTYQNKLQASNCSACRSLTRAQCLFTCFSYEAKFTYGERHTLLLSDEHGQMCTAQPKAFSQHRILPSPHRVASCLTSVSPSPPQRHHRCHFVPHRRVVLVGEFNMCLCT